MPWLYHAGSDRSVLFRTVGVAAAACSSFCSTLQNSSNIPHRVAAQLCVHGVCQIWCPQPSSTVSQCTQQPHILACSTHTTPHLVPPHPYSRSSCDMRACVSSLRSLRAASGGLGLCSRPTLKVGLSPSLVVSSRVDPTVNHLQAALPDGAAWGSGSAELGRAVDTGASGPVCCHCRSMRHQEVCCRELGPVGQHELDALGA